MNKLNVGGRPKKFATPNDLAKVINEYFDNTPFDEYSITGLALTVGSKQLIQDYQERDGYDNIIIRAKLIIEHSYEVSLRKAKQTGSNYIFALKNMGWSDRREIEHSGSNISITFSDKSKEGITYLTGVNRKAESDISSPER